MKIEISEELYERLGRHVNGFETPADVITRILDQYELRNTEKRPDLVFEPDEEGFKKELLSKKQAWKIFEFDDGRKQIEEWSANQFNENSNLRGNIWSGALRDWKNKGIKQLTLTTVDPRDEGHAMHTNSSDTIELQVGKLVKHHIDSIVEYCNRNAEHVNLLANKEWCTYHLGISFPLIMLSNQVQSDGVHVRYWIPEYTIQGQQYRFCSQFGGNNAIGTKTLSEYHGEKFLQYLKNYGLILQTYAQHKIRFIVRGIGS